MKKSLLTLMVVAGLVAAAQAQLSITALYSPLTENFNAYEGTEASIPSNFAFTDTDFSPGGYYNSAGTYSNANSNYALMDANISLSDIAFGQKGPTSGTDYLNWSMVNNSGVNISVFTVTWDFKQFSQSGRASTLAFNYNPNETGFTTVGITGERISSAVTGIEGNLASVLVTSMSVTVTLETPLAVGESIVFGWGFGSGTGSGGNAHIGVDNISVTAVPEPHQYAVAMAGLLLTVVVMRRRRTC